MRYILSSFLIFFLFCSTASAALYHMSLTGTRTSGVSTADDWTNANCYASLSTVIPEMVGGDELIINDEAYTGLINQISISQQYPPDGTAEAYTIIRARNPGQVLFDGEDTRSMFDYDGNSNPMQYVEFHGLKWRNGSGDRPAVYFYGSTYVKFFRCGFYDSGGDTAADNEATFSAFFSTYCLVEDCYAWGNGRYKFLSYTSQYLVFRRCVARFDYVYEETEPKAGISVYNSDFIEVQNCIVVDGDTRSQWADGPTYTSADWQVDGCFYTPNKSNFSTNVFFRGCIAINNQLPFASTSGEGDGGPILFENCVGYDLWDVTEVFRADETTLDHCTLSLFSNPGVGNGETDGSLPEGDPVIDNIEASQSIFTDNVLANILLTSAVGNVIVGGAGTGQWSSVDNNCLYSLKQSDNDDAFSGDTNTITSNPFDTDILYLIRVETGTPLSGAASDTGDVGATILKKIGTSGTVYGEPGYATTTNDDLWPFPYEDTIKTDMAAYTNYSIDGSRGFADSTANPRTDTGEVTLTSYIWEYLGNTDATAGLYGVGEEPNIQGCTIGAGVSIQ